MKTYYYCDTCGAVIEDEDLAVCRIKEGEFWKLVTCCPHCKNDYLEEMERCKMCGALIREGEYCDECNREVYKIWDRAVTEVMSLRDERGDMDSDWMACRDAFIEYLDDTGVL